MPKTKFHKANYKVVIADWKNNSYAPKTEKETRKGLVTANFGVHYKLPKQLSYTVTHLKSGYKVADFHSFNEAKKFMSQAELIPTIDLLTINNSRSYADEMKALRDKIIKEARK